MNENLITKDTTAATIQPPGDLVAASLPALRAEIREMVSSGVSSITIDLASTHMVDSAGIGLLISTHNSLKKVDGQLSVVNASPDVLQLFQTMRINQHFSVKGV